MMNKIMIKFIQIQILMLKLISRNILMKINPFSKILIIKNNSNFSK